MRGREFGIGGGGGWGGGLNSYCVPFAEENRLNLGLQIEPNCGVRDFSVGDKSSKL